MKALRPIIMFWLLMGLSIAARNQDARNMESLNEGVFMVKAVYVDSDGVKWFGTNKGLCRYNELSWRYYTDADHLVPLRHRSRSRIAGVIYAPVSPEAQSPEGARHSSERRVLEPY